MKNNILINESWTNATEGYRTGESGVYETFTNDKGELYKLLVREYGRCISKVYIDSLEESGDHKAIGWVFEKRVKYDDCNKTYLLETWVTLHKSEPVKTIEYKYLFI
jgi:hypothetical protein